MLKIVDLFEDTRFQWGLRGDPHLWDALRDYFVDVDWPVSAEIFQTDLETAFHEITGHPIDSETHFFVEQFSHGGMSSGRVSPQFWRERALPILTKRFRIAEWRVEHAAEIAADEDPS